VPEIHQTKHGVTIAIKVVPNASKDQVAGFLDDRLKIRVSAPPESGKANKAICTLLALVLDVPNKDVLVIAGHTNPMKTVVVNGISLGAVLRCLNTP